MTTPAPAPRPGRPPDPKRLAFAETRRRAHGNLSAVARTLGISRQTAGKWAKLDDAGTLLDAFPPALRRSDPA